ncbi:inactive leucine-rich repeat receptor-like serine/threonine-protein kinase At1g60630 [Apium graveolens]|uniref:inactive leucine-rich repeat receptor-like serine/threonine-protein kinase At1g60630 n=1 Tax=Apium graveolens TaxID=4045 RepID=UPI003D78E67E
MNRICIWAFLISFLFLLHSTQSVDDVQTTLVKFIQKLSSSNDIPDPSWGWNLSSDPCKDQWKGVTCSNKFQVQNLLLDGLNFSGTFDPWILCTGDESFAESLNELSLNDNRLQVENLEGISSCKYLSRLHLRGNLFSGNIPDSMSRLNNLKTLEISQNQFSGVLPNFARISGLTEFLAQDNEFSGFIPKFDFPNFLKFNVSKNNFSGPIPNGGSRFPSSSFDNNSGLCGEPLPNKCPPDDRSKSGYSTEQILMFSGYFLIGLVVVLLILYKFCKKGKKNTKKVSDTIDLKVEASDYDGSTKLSIMSSDKSEANKSETSATSVESAKSLVVLSSPEVNGLRFEELLKAPAELIGRGKHGSVYKVICEGQGLTMAVKRIKDWSLSSSDFKIRMKRLDQVRHPSVLPPIAFYCSKQEKLLVYEYQPNGSLFKLLHGDQLIFDWSSRLSLAATIAKALAFMHEELREDLLAHGNLKSSNILLNENMEPCISEYGLRVENQELSMVSISNIQAAEENAGQNTFKSDVYAFGVILLEMLTGKVASVQNNGMDLAKYVVSVIKEEWTGEVFDRGLSKEGASEERMVNLLQIAIQCVNQSPEARPSISQVALMIDAIKEEDDTSMDISISQV